MNAVKSMKLYSMEYKIFYFFFVQNHCCGPLKQGTFNICLNSDGY